VGGGGWPAQESIPSLAKSIPRNRFLGFLNVYKYRLIRALAGGESLPSLHPPHNIPNRPPRSPTRLSSVLLMFPASCGQRFINFNYKMLGYRRIGIHTMDGREEEKGRKRG